MSEQAPTPVDLSVSAEVTPPQRLLYLSRGDVERLDISPASMIASLERAVVHKRRGTVELPPKIGIHPRDDAFIHAMPAYLPDEDVAGIKWVSGYPSNSARAGVPYLHGLLVLTDADTGRPACVMDATWITEQRTAAMSVLGIRALLRAEPSSVAIIGCGRQGLAHLELIRATFPSVGTALLHDPVDDAARALADTVSDKLSVRLGSILEVAADADIVVTCAPIVRDPKRPLGLDAVRRDAVVCAVDFDAIVDADVAEGAVTFVVDDVAQYLQYRQAGYFAGYPADPIELADVLGDGQTVPRGVRLYTPLGIALADMVLAARVHAAAGAARMGLHLPIWAPTAEQT